MKFIETTWRRWQRFLQPGTKQVATAEAIRLAKLEYSMACDAAVSSGAADWPGSGQCLEAEKDRAEIARLQQIEKRGFTTVDLSEATIRL